MSKEKEHLVVKASGLGICLFILFFGILAGDIVLSNEDMEFFPKSVILLTASVCAGISFRLLLKRGFVWDRIGETDFQEKKNSLNRRIYEFFHPFKIKYEDAPPDSTVLEKKLTVFKQEYAGFCKGQELRYTVTNFYRHILQLQKKRLDRLGLRMEVSLERKCYTQETPVRESCFFDGCFLHTAASENVAGFYRYLQGNRTVFEQRNNDCADYDLIGALKARDGQAVTCPSCGAKAKMEEMTSGCPYCGVKFRMEDLSERVSGFALRKDYRLLETVFQGKLYAYAKTIIFAVALMLCALAVWWMKPLEGLTVAGFSYSIGVFLFTAVLCLLVTIVSVMVISIPLLAVLGVAYRMMRPSLFPHVRRERRTDTHWKDAVRFDKNFSLQDFFANVENKLSGIHFADTEEQVNAFSCLSLTDFLPGYRDVASCSFDSLELLDFRVDGDRQLTRVRAEMELLRWRNGTMKEEKESVELLLAKAASCLAQAVFEPIVLRCRSCGSSLDLMEGRRCLYCGREMELENYDWSIREYKIV